MLGNYHSGLISDLFTMRSPSIIDKAFVPSALDWSPSRQAGTLWRRGSALPCLALQGAELSVCHYLELWLRAVELTTS